MPKISVIIPLYNTEKYIEKCLNSVREQSFEDIEIICVDDCSPDNSSAIVEQLMLEDKRIKLIKHEVNQGLGGARNTAIRAAQSEYLASVDSDDYMSAKMLETLWSNTNNQQVDIVCCGYNRVSEQGEILAQVQYGEKELENKNNSIDIFSALNPAFWNKLWKKNLFIDNSIFFPTHDYYEDMSTTPKLLAKATSIRVINDCLYNYLVRPESITGSYGAKHTLDYFKGFESLFDFLHRESLQERYVKEFDNYIVNNIMFHSKSILSADLFIEDKKQYLRNLLLFRTSFQENYQSIKNRDIDDLILIQRRDFSGVYKKKYEVSEQQLADKTNLVEKHTTSLADLRAKYSSSAEEVGLLKRENSKLQHENNDLSRINSSLVYEKLSFGQQFVVILFSFFAKPTMSQKMRTKLRETPRSFFADSSNELAKKFARLFKIIDQEHEA